MLIITDSRRTSGVARSTSDLLNFQAGVPAPDTGMSETPQTVVSGRCSAESLISGASRFASGKREIFNAQVRINSPAVGSFISAEIDKIDGVAYRGSAVPVRCSFDASRVIRRVENTTVWAVQTWTSWVAEPIETDLSALLGEAREIVAAIRNHSPVNLSADAEALIDQAAEVHGAPDDIEAWARRLANDVRRLTD